MSAAVAQLLADYSNVLEREDTFGLERRYKSEGAKDFIEWAAKQGFVMVAASTATDPQKASAA